MPRHTPDTYAEDALASAAARIRFLEDPLYLVRGEAKIERFRPRMWYLFDACESITIIDRGTQNKGVTCILSKTPMDEELENMGNGHIFGTVISDWVTTLIMNPAPEGMRENALGCPIADLKREDCSARVEIGDGHEYYLFPLSSPIVNGNSRWEASFNLVRI